MTGRDLIIYILENNLENEQFYQNHNLLYFLSIEEEALKFNVGINTVKAWLDLDLITGVKIREKIYVGFHVSPVIPNFI